LKKYADTKRGEGGNKGAHLDGGASSSSGATTEADARGTRRGGTTTGTNFLLDGSSASSESVTSSLSITLRLGSGATDFSSWLSETSSVAARSWGIASLRGVDHTISTKFAARGRVSSSCRDGNRSRGRNGRRNWD